MPKVKVTVGARHYTMSCQPGQEGSLEAAARLLDTQAQTLLESAAPSQAGAEPAPVSPRLPEAQMLLMSGLLIADKLSTLELELRDVKEQLAAAQKRAQQAAHVPEGLERALAEIAQEAENAAEYIEKMTASGGG